ncbi:MAG: sulfatase [Candidatus Hydrogenedentes bacterium]|nr:sulfatase [Candidatus Hydrogenedentota bacterium]
MTAGAGSVSLLAAKGAHAQEQPRKRNVLLYVTDDQGTGDAGCYGSRIAKTPGMDALAREGVRMNSAYCTTPSCSPSRSVLLTGLHNHANGQYGLEHSYHHFASFPNIKTLPVLLAGAGYRTASAGKFHVAPKDTYQFQQYIGGPSPSEMADNCLPFLAARDEAPFFLYFCTTEPHRNFKRDGADPVRPENVVVPAFLPDTPETRLELAAYYASLQRADSGLVRLIKILHDTGHWEDTLIICLSDNGIPFPGAKTNLYEPGIHLPCIVRNPYSGRRDASCDAMVTWADITPTILDFAQVRPDAESHGRSFLSAIEEDNPKDWDETYASHTFHEVTMYYPMRMVRTRKYKLIWNIAHGLEFPFASDLYGSKTWQAVLSRHETHYGPRSVEALLKRPAFELYDLESDPNETNNLADDPAHAEVLADLKSKLKSFQERTRDPWILKWERE